jgi:hypothetical protein
MSEAIVDAEIATFGPSEPFNLLSEACHPCFGARIVFGEAK